MARDTTPSEMEKDLSDSESATSSVVYDHEPFETFRTRVLDLAQYLWKECSTENTDIQRMSGGGFNRIIGISKKSSEQDPGFDYVLRIPRFDEARLDRDVAALQYVRKLGDIPIPDIVMYDTTSDNKIGSSYMIQTRLSGEDLFTAFPDLNHDDKLRVARELGHVFHQMLDVESDVAGLLSIEENTNETETWSNRGFVEPFFGNKKSASSKDKFTPSTFELLGKIFKARKLDGLENYPLDTLRPRLMDKFTTMAAELHVDGWFEGVQISLCHLDLAPRNILVNPTSKSSEPIITGILDWDSAALAPSFMSCGPPLWIWAWQDDADEDERMANDTPPTEEGRELKKEFEQAAGPLYVRYAYPSVYRLARRLVRFAIHGIRSSEDVDEAEAMLKEWSEIRQNLEKPEERLQ